VLARFFEVTRRPVEGVALFDAAARATADAAPRSTQAIVLRALGTMHYRNGNLTAADAAIRAAMRFYRGFSNRASLRECVLLLGMIAWTRAEVAIAQKHFDRAARLAREAGDDAGGAVPLNALAACARALGDFERAFTLQQQALHLYEGVGDTLGQAVVLNDLGAMLRQRRRYAESELTLERGLAVCQAHQLAFVQEYCLYNLAMTQIEVGQLDAAQSRLRQATKLDQSAGASLVSALLRLAMGRIHVRRGNTPAAAALLQQALERTRGLASVPMQLFALSFVAEWFNARGVRARAAALWSFLAAHPQYEAGERADARHALEQLDLTAAEARSVKRAARSFDLDSLAATLIAELTPERPRAVATSRPTPAQRPAP
jgi:tetratricopeptide (TPR) repeat protein